MIVRVDDVQEVSLDGRTCQISYRFVCVLSVLCCAANAMHATVCVCVRKRVKTVTYNCNAACMHAGQQIVRMERGGKWKLARTVGCTRA